MAGVSFVGQERHASEQVTPVTQNGRFARTTTFFVTERPGCTAPSASSCGLTVTSATTRPSTSMGIWAAFWSFVTRISCPLTYPAGVSGLSFRLRS